MEKDIISEETEKHNKLKLGTKEIEFNPRISEAKVEEERFFAFESQKSHH